jgi:tetratricopeptide (TPR) repeat protein
MALALGVASTGSRANLGLLPVAFLFVALAAFAAEEDRRQRVRILRVVAGGACLAAAAFFVVATPRWFEEVGKLIDVRTMLSDRVADDAWSIGLGVIAGHAWIGVGHGAFPVASSDAGIVWGGAHLTFAHNIVIQAIADWGLPVAAVAGALFLGGFASALRRAAARPALFAVAIGLLVVVLQNQVDFSLLVPGVGIAAACAAGALAAAVRHDADEKARRRIRLVALPPSAIAVLAGVLALTSVHAWNHDVDRLAGEARTALAGGRPGSVDLEALLRHHPRDFFLYRLAAVVSDARGDAEARDRLADRALALAPGEPGTLGLRARLHLRDGEGLLALPYVFATASHGRGAVLDNLKLLLPFQKTQDVLERFLARSEKHVLELVGLLRAQGPAAPVAEVLEWALARFPASPEVREQLAEQLLVTPGAIERLDRLVTDTLGRAGLEEDPAARDRLLRHGYLMQGYVFQRKSQVEEARVMLEEAARLDPAGAERPLRALGVLYADQGDTARLRDLLPRLRAALPEGRHEHGDFHVLESRLAEAEGEVRDAIRSMQKALLYVPEHAGHAERLARLYESGGDADAAQAVRDRASRSAASR